MVEEGVTWFAQVAPRQPRTLVVVVPPLAWIFAPLPLLIALFGVVRIRNPQSAIRNRPCRRARGASPTLATKPLVLAHEALLEPTRGRVLVDPRASRFSSRCSSGWSCLAASVRGCCCSSASFCSTLILADVVYYRFFGDVLSAPAMLAAHQTGHVWGSVGSLFTPGLLWLIIDWPFASGWRFVCHGDAWRDGAGAAASTIDRRGDRRPRADRPGVVGAARARLDAARSDVPGAFGRRAARAVRLSRLRHVELRCAATWLRPPATPRNWMTRSPGCASARRCAPAVRRSAPRAART